MDPTRRVVLLHGLWMWPAAMGVLARRLAHAGFDCERIGYPSVRGPASAAVSRVAQVLREGECDVVAHSLGGLMALHALEAEPDLPVRRVVCLGSPLCGSLAASRLERLPVLGASLGHSRRVLHRGCRPWRGRAQVGMVAGCRPLGLGRLLGRIEGANDGAVGVVETRLDGLADHVVLPTSHTGMIFSDDVARQVVAFLRDGRFRH
ncbi:MAG TPA: alpha/beta fold hydrolase [Lysobacter sp.]|nr:alpha/beta fold hydrolase [Lysobacter sp.]